MADSEGVWRVVWSRSNASLIVSCSVEGTINIWHFQEGSLTVRHTLRGHAGPVFSVSLSPDGAHLVSGSEDKTARVWKVDGGQQVQELEGHTADVYSVAWSHDGKYIVSGSGDTTVRVWGVDEQVCVCVLACACLYIHTYICTYIHE